MQKVVVLLLLLVSTNCLAEVFTYKLHDGTLTIVEKPLDQAKFKKNYGEWSVNTMGWEGGKLPETEIMSITFETKKQKYVLDSTHLFNADAGKVESRVVSECMGSYCTVRVVFGKGMAAYAVQWVMRDGISRRSALTSDPIIRNSIYKMIQTLKRDPNAGKPSGRG